MINVSAVSVGDGSGLGMDVMLATVLGGMSIFGGSRSNAYAGCWALLTVAALNKGLLMVGVSSAFIQGIRGVIFLLLVWMNGERQNLLPSACSSDSPLQNCISVPGTLEHMKKTNSRRKHHEKEQTVPVRAFADAGRRHADRLRWLCFLYGSFTAASTGSDSTAASTASDSAAPAATKQYVIGIAEAQANDEVTTRRAYLEDFIAPLTMSSSSSPRP